ncbi:MAG TPA: hypothetical protein VGI87_09835 [Solirubrobacteraceae bacterium]
MGAIVIVAVSASAAPNGRPPTSASNRAAAASDAKTLLSQLILPAGSVQLAAKPSWDHWPSDHCPCPATPNVEDAHGWWQVPDDVDSVIAFVKAHTPEGSTLVSGGPDVMFRWPPEPGVLSTRWLEVEANTLPDGSTAVRADGESVWTVPRPASERVPPAGRVQLTVTHGERVLQGPIEIRSHRRVAKIRALLNSLPAAQPGVYSCPGDPGVRIILEFFGRRIDATPTAKAIVSDGGCGFVGLVLRGHREPDLGGSGVDVVRPLLSIIGRHLKTR